MHTYIFWRDRDAGQANKRTPVFLDSGPAPAGHPGMTMSQAPRPAATADSLEERRQQRRYPDRPIVAVLAVVMRGERALIVQRAQQPNIGRWGFPGGVLELGETVAEGAMRELLEETGIIAKPAGTLKVFNAIERDDDGRVRYHYTLIAVRGIWQSGEGEAGDDAGAVAWLSRDEIVAQDLTIAPMLLPLMKLALATRR